MEPAGSECRYSIRLGSSDRQEGHGRRHDVHTSERHDRHHKCYRVSSNVWMGHICVRQVCTFPMPPGIAQDGPKGRTVLLRHAYSGLAVVGPMLVVVVVVVVAAGAAAVDVA